MSGNVLSLNASILTLAEAAVKARLKRIDNFDEKVRLSIVPKNSILLVTQMMKSLFQNENEYLSTQHRQMNSVIDLLESMELTEITPDKVSELSKIWLQMHQTEISYTDILIQVIARFTEIWVDSVILTDAVIQNPELTNIKDIPEHKLVEVFDELDEDATHRITNAWLPFCSFSEETVTLLGDQKQQAMESIIESFIAGTTPKAIAYLGNLDEILSEEKEEEIAPQHKAVVIASKTNVVN